MSPGGSLKAQRPTDVEVTAAEDLRLSFARVLKSSSEEGVPSGKAGVAVERPKAEGGVATQR